METREQLGRISRAEFGWGGYQDAMIGLSLSFEHKGSGCGHFDGFWGIERSSFAEWTEGDRTFALGEMVMRLAEILSKAKCQSVSDLIGKPVMVTYEGIKMKDWRILDEVL